MIQDGVHLQQDHHPTIFVKTLGKGEDDFVQVHSDFVVNQVRTFLEAGEEWENLDIVICPVSSIYIGCL